MYNGGIKMMYPFGPANFETGTRAIDPAIFEICVRAIRTED